MASTGANEKASWEFIETGEARAYLREVAWLWGAWAVSLVGIFLADGFAVLPVAAAIFAAMIWFSRPLHRRADRIGSEGDEVVGNWVQVAFGRGTKRDRLVRDLMYGEAPLRAALDAAGRSRHWMWARRVIAAATVAAFFWLILRPI